VQVDVPCPKCGGPMALKQGRRGGFLGCMNYPKCRGTAQLSDELKEKLGDAATAVAAPAAPRLDLKSIVVDEPCEQCGGAMVVRRGRRGPFLGCGNYPKCKNTREPDEVTLSRIAAFESGQAAPTPAGTASDARPRDVTTRLSDENAGWPTLLWPSRVRWNSNGGQTSASAEPTATSRVPIGSQSKGSVVGRSPVRK
jgi:ssDNA-binding Zn-finger/Zn-ribbon topoisomerase 1